MLAHLQNLITAPGGGGGGGKNKPPSIQPNDYMDSLLADIKASMKERYYLHDINHSLLLGYLKISIIDKNI